MLYMTHTLKKNLVDLMYIISGHRTQAEPCNKPQVTEQCRQANGA